MRFTHDGAGVARAPWWVFVLCLGACNGGKIAGGKVDGPVLYEVACARCHGDKGVPTPGMRARSGVKPLTSDKVRAMSDEGILAQIRKGSKNGMMPAFEDSMSDAQLQALLGHIRSLGADGKTGAVSGD